MIISHNLVAMNAQRQFNIANTSRRKSTEKLSSGYRINRAADDAAGLTISENMRRKVRGLSQGIDNTHDGVSMCQIADGALNEVHDMLHRLTELTVKSANGTNTAEDRQAIQKEIDQIIEEIDKVSDRATFNTIKIFDKGVKDTASSGIPGAGSSDINKWMAGINSIAVSGTPTDYTESTYIFSANENDGISINGNLYGWDSIKSSNGDSIDELKAGTYSISHNGVTFSLDLLDKSTLEDVAKSMNGVKAITTGAHESRTLTNTNNYRMPISMWGYDDSLDHSLNFTNNAIKIDDNSLNKYDLSAIDWNDILGISKGANGATKSEYDIKLSYILADGHEYPVPAKGASFPYTEENQLKIHLETSGNYTRDEFVNAANGKTFDFWLDEELEHGAKWSISITGKYQIEQSNGSTEIEGPFPVQHKEETKNDGNLEPKTEELYKQIWIQSGAEKGDGMWLYFGEMNSEVLGIRGLSASTAEDAKDSIDKIQDALAYVSESRSRIGAQQNRLEHTIFNEQNIVENTQAAESRIRDTDMATEMVNNAKYNILEQAITSMMSQANQSTQGVLSLLQ